jgi:predicted PhzF superfamily epimerase YddE/YHI9
MPIPLLMVDAFTARRYSGNPAGVCLLTEPAEPEWMRAVAAELAAAETAYLVRTGEAAFDLRWFSPTKEIPLCGHATLAAAHVLWEQELVADRGIEFATAAGPLRAWRAAEGWIEMDFPASRYEPVEAGTPERGTAEDLGRALSVEVVEAERHGRDWLLQVEGVAGVLGADPDFARVAELGDMVTVTAVMTSGSGGDSGDSSAGPALPPAAAGADFVSRTFVPAWGIPEDPVTGSAHCSLGPFWEARLSRVRLTGYQASKRGGVVRVRVDGDRVVLGGQAVTVFEAQLTG